MSLSEGLPDSLASALAKLAITRPIALAYTHLIISSIFPIYAGAHASLSRPSTADKPTRRAKKSVEDDDEDEEDSAKMEGLSNADAIILPIVAGLVLATLYFLIYKYGAKMINLIMGWYFSAVSIYSITQFIRDATKLIVGFVFPTYYSSRGMLWIVDGKKRQAHSADSKEESVINSPLPGVLNRLPLPSLMRSSLWKLRQCLRQKYIFKAYMASMLDVSTRITLIDIFAGLFSIGLLIYVNFFSRPWYLTNLQGFAVSYSALQLLSPTTFATGSLVLSALFCYDIWAVFFTPLMVTVATELDQPIKLIFPREKVPGVKPEDPPIQQFSMLGLGDIVVPGIMIGLALRFDLYMFYLKKQKQNQTKTPSKTEAKVTEVVKAQYVSPKGHFANRFWTAGLPRASLPPSMAGIFPKPYFTASLIGYVAGMTTTLIVMTFFDHAQPALLYLVPGVLVSLWGTGLVRGELEEMWHFTEAVDAKQIEDEKKGSRTANQKDDMTTTGVFSWLWPGNSEKVNDSKGRESVIEEKVDNDGGSSGQANRRSTSKIIDTATIKNSDSLPNAQVSNNPEQNRDISRNTDNNLIFIFSLALCSSLASTTADESNSDLGTAETSTPLK